jgi:hypothetical protein
LKIVSTISNTVEPQLTIFLALKKRFHLGEIRATLDEFSASGLPDEIELKAVDSLILKTFEHWHVPLDQLLKSLEEVLRSAMQKTITETTSRWTTTSLPTEIARICDHFLDTHLGDLRDNVAARALRLERRKPITDDENTMKRYTQEELDVFNTARFKARTDVYFDQQDVMNGKGTGSEERERKRQNNPDVLKAKLGADPFDREIRVMAKIRAYYQIASVRFVDHIRQSIEAELFVKFRDGLLDDLLEGLRVMQPDCKSFSSACSL